MTTPADDNPISHPKHYTSHPSGIECIQVTEHMNFNTGNAIKYIWRADLKHNAVEDLEKAKWYLEREIARRKKNDETEWQLRVIQERDELAEKESKLRMFLDSFDDGEDSNWLEPKDLILLTKQQFAMLDYILILNMRIERFEK